MKLGFGAAAGVLILVGACTSSTAPIPSSSGAGAASAPSSVAPAPVACADSGPSIPRGSALNDVPGLAPPGRALFVEAGALRVYEGGRVQAVPTPYPVLSTFARLTLDGRAVALVGKPDAAEVYLWTQGATPALDSLTRIPAPYKQDESGVIWSPGMRAAMYSASFHASEIFVAQPGGVIRRVSLGADLMHIALWRSDDELTLVTGKPQQNFPLAAVTLWSWRPPQDPVRIAGPVILSTYPKWSSDGRFLATIEEESGGRAVHLRSPEDRVVLTESGLTRGAAGCVRDSIRLNGLDWSPVGQTLAILGAASSGAAVVFTDGSGRSPTVFTAPIGVGSCYLPGRVEWSAGRVVVPLYGPDCGMGSEGLTNALAIVDPNTGVVAKYVPISRKGFAASSGGWAAMSAGTNEAKTTTFFSLDDPTMRMTVPLSPLIDYCCVP